MDFGSLDFAEAESSAAGEALLGVDANEGYRDLSPASRFAVNVAISSIAAVKIIAVEKGCRMEDVDIDDLIEFYGRVKPA